MSDIRHGNVKDVTKFLPCALQLPQRLKSYANVAWALSRLASFIQSREDGHIIFASNAVLKLANSVNVCKNAEVYEDMNVSNTDAIKSAFQWIGISLKRPNKMECVRFVIAQNLTRTLKEVIKLDLWQLTIHMKLEKFVDFFVFDATPHCINWN